VTTGSRRSQKPPKLWPSARAAGYQTAAFVSNPVLDKGRSLGQGFQVYDQHMNRRERNRPGYRERDAENTTDATLAWAQVAAREPWFVWVHYQDPHGPYAPPEPARARFLGDALDGADQRELAAGKTHSGHGSLPRYQVLGGERRLAEYVRLYDAEIRYLDSQIGVLLIDLEVKGLLDESLIVFVSDHGEELLDHDSVLHGYTLYEEQLRIPLMIRHPEFPARRVSRLSRQVDVFPTLLELLGFPIPEFVQGESLVAAMRGEQEAGAGSEVPVFAEASLRAVRTVALDSYSLGDWKLIETRVPEARRQLFNLRDDPQERHDRLASEPEVAARLTAELQRFRDALPVGRSEVVPLSDEEIRELQSLGYLPKE